MVDKETLDGGMDDAIEELVELGSVSGKTHGLFIGPIPEISIVPYRLLPPPGG